MSLDYFRIEATLAGRWADLNDGVNFKVASDPTLATTSRAKRRITTSSPVLDGEYLLHATTGLVTESLKFWVYGVDQADLHNNIALIEEIFDQYDYRVRITWDNYVETWECQMADTVTERSHVYSHSTMAGFSAQVIRMPSVLRQEVI